MHDAGRMSGKFLLLQWYQGLIFFHQIFVYFGWKIGIENICFTFIREVHISFSLSSALFSHVLIF